MKVKYRRPLHLTELCACAVLQTAALEPVEQMQHHFQPVHGSAQPLQPQESGLIFTPQQPNSMLAPFASCGLLKEQEQEEVLIMSHNSGLSGNFMMAVDE